MTKLIVQDLTNAAAGRFTLVVASVGCRRDIFAHVAKNYPNFHVVAFA